MDTASLYGIAKELTDLTGFGPGGSLLDIAVAAGIAVIPSEKFACVPPSLLLDASSRFPDPQRARSRFAHELGHLLLARAGEPDSEDDAWAIGRALLMPPTQFESDLKSAHWNLRLLVESYQVTWHLAAWRAAELCDGVSRIYDNRQLSFTHGRIPRTFRSRTLPWERALARGCSATKRDRRWAYYVPNGDWERIISLVPADRWWHRYSGVNCAAMDAQIAPHCDAGHS